ncbi:MAG: SMC-Scp complex subunit ScpB [Gammaproteobacteria bacterium]
MNDYELKRIVEAVLFVSEKPMTVKEIWRKLFSPGVNDASNDDKDVDDMDAASDQADDAAQEAPQTVEALAPSQGEKSESDEETDRTELPEVTTDDVFRVIGQLQEEYAERGCELQAVASGYRFQVHHDLAVWVQRWKTEKAPRYSRAVLETLAIIAYKQPITRAEIEDIRGVAVSSQIVKGLLEREWVRIVGHKELPGRPALFATTKQFLDYFNVNSLEALPTLAEIKELGVRHLGTDQAFQSAESVPTACSNESQLPSEPVNTQDLVAGVTSAASEIETDNVFENAVESFHESEATHSTLSAEPELEFEPEPEPELELELEQDAAPDENRNE